MTTFHAISTSFKEHFKLQHGQDILKFFPKSRNSVLEFVDTKVERLRHYFDTGVVINERELCKWAEAHAEEQLSRLFSQRPVARRLIRHESKMTFTKDSFWKWLKTQAKFFGEFCRHPFEVGAILPSSPDLAREIVSEIPKDSEALPRRILEVGPGTGVFTEKIIKRMNPEDRLVLVEFDAEFCKQLKAKFGHIPNVEIVQGDIAEHQPSEKYDFIVSGLPLNAFRVQFVKKIFDKFENDLIKEGGKISYFEYIGVPKIKRLLSSPEDKENLDKILALKKDFYKGHKCRKAEVFLNAPAARVLHHEMIKQQA